MKRRHLTIGTAALVLILLFSSLSVGAQGRPSVWVWYFSTVFGPQSYQESWVKNGDVPLRGEYDTRDGNTMGGQIDEARGAGVDAFIVSWFGEGEPQTSLVVENAFGQGAARGFNIAVSIDSFDGNFNRSVNQLSASLNRTMTDYINRSNYLRYQGKPIIFFTFQDAAGLSSAQWQQLRNQHDPNRATWWVSEGVNGCCIYNGAMDGMWTFNLSFAANVSGLSRQQSRTARAGGSIWFPTIHPGWDESVIASVFNRPNPAPIQDRAGGQFLTNSYNAAVATGADAIIINSWNEFYEGSFLEPTRDTGTVALDTLRALTAGQTPVVQAPPTGNTAPPVAGVPGQLSLEANVRNLSVRSGPGTNFGVIGTISPGTLYPVIAPVGEWVQFNFNGQEAFVLASRVSPRSGGSVAPSTGNVAPPVAAAPGQLSLEANVRNLNVRSGPGTNFGIVGTISPGTLYPVIEPVGDWVRFNFNGQEAFVFASLVSPR
ncbi:MAG: endo-1,3-alpha-glucanase family glycosylhydrolase [Aggregatilineales bacterium]